MTWRGQQGCPSCNGTGLMRAEWNDQRGSYDAAEPCWCAVPAARWPKRYACECHGTVHPTPESATACEAQERSPGYDPVADMRVGRAQKE